MTKIKIREKAKNHLEEKENGNDSISSKVSKVSKKINARNQNSLENTDKVENFR